jgi:hypothetical protein
MNPIQSAWALVKENKRAYIVFNVLYYGLVLVFMGVAAMNPAVQDELIRVVGESFMTGPLAVVGEAYVNLEVLNAIGLTFVVNLLLASLLVITVPSLVIPFSGLLMGIYRAVLWGLIFFPGHPDMQVVMIPHSLTLILEGQAYILVMLAAWLQGRAFLFPQSAGVEGHLRGYLEGLKRTGKIYLLVILTLFVAAVYEVIEVVLLAQMMGGA